MRSVQHVVVAGVRIWVSGYASKLLAWFEWADDELVYAGSAEFGEIHSLVSGPPGPGGVQHLYAAGDNSIKTITTQPPFNPLPLPEPP
jgi:hypothetical protein